jgi:hypothetical protein
VLGKRRTLAPLQRLDHPIAIGLRPGESTLPAIEQSRA